MEMKKQIYSSMISIKEFSSIIIIAMVVCLFMKFRTIKVKSNILKNIVTKFISPSILSVYIIHENINIVDYWKYFNIDLEGNIIKIVTCIMIVVILIFFACIVIDFIRIKICQLIKKVYSINKFVQFLNLKIDILNNKINSYLENEKISQKETLLLKN